MAVEQSVIVDNINKLGIDYKISGSEYKLHHCPYCETNGETSKPYHYFGINVEKDVYRCYHQNSCNVTGKTYKLFLDMGIISPLVVSAKSKKIDPPEVTGLKTSDDFFSWYKENRGINQETLKFFGVKYKDDANGRHIVYTYKDEHGKTINRKYRHTTNKANMRQEKGCVLGYYGLQNVKFSKKAIFVCEGEDDAHALSQYGVENVVSVPSGASSYTEEMDRINGKFDRIYTIFDTDDAGQKGAYEFAKKAGLYKVYNCILPFKDARDCLINGVGVEVIKLILKAGKRYESDDILSAADLKEKFIADISGDKYSGTMIEQSSINMLLGGVRVGEVSVLTGHTGSGKSTFGLNFLHWCEYAGMPGLIMSFENRTENIIRKMIEIDTGDSIKSYDEITGRWKLNKDNSWLDYQVDKLALRKIWFLNRSATDTGYYDIKSVIKIIEYAAKFHNVKFVLIDHLHYFTKLSGAANPVHVIDDTVRAIVKASERLEIHSMLVVHPAKTNDKDGKLERLTVNSGKGASSIQQEASNYWIVSKSIEDDGTCPKSRVDLVKNREFGRTGKIMFDVANNYNKFYGGIVL